MRWSTAAGVGVVVVVAAAILVASFVLLESAGVIGNTYPVVVDFLDAQGITKGTEVRLAGVKIGEVDDVALSPGNRALLKLKILQKYTIPGDATFRLAQSGLLTTPIVAIVPARQWSSEKGVLHGVSPPSLDQLLPEAQKLLTNLSGLSKSMESLIGDPKLRQNLSRSTANIAEVSEKSKTIVANLQVASEGGRRIVSRFQQTTGRLDNTVAMLQQTVGENRQKLGQTLTSVNDTMDALKGLVEQLTSVVSDPKVKGGLRGTVANVEQATANLAKLSANLQQLSSDPKLNEDLRATVSGTRATVEQTQILLERLNHILGSGRKGVAGARGKVREKVQNTDVTLDLAEQTNPGRTRLDLNAFFPAGDGRFLRAGINDLTERNRLNLQLGRPFLGNSVRYGLYSSRLGLGLDFGAPSHPLFSADLYSVAHPQLDLRARANIREGLDLTLGLQSTFHRNTPTVGVTWRK